MDIAYVSRRGEVPFSRRSMGLVVGSRDRPERLFTPDADGVHDPRWAPDGVHVLFNARTGNNDRLEILSTGDGTMRELSPVDAWRFPNGPIPARAFTAQRGAAAVSAFACGTFASGRESELAWPVNVVVRRVARRAVARDGVVERDGVPAIGVQAGPEASGVRR